MYLVEFVDGDDSFVAFGDDPWHLPVYKKTDVGLKRLEMKYPSCVRFMPYADEGPIETISRNELFTRYSSLRTCKDRTLLDVSSHGCTIES